MNKTPDRAGIWEWFDQNGKKRLVEVVNCSSFPDEVYLRVYFAGGYYNVHPVPDNFPFDEIEWTGPWGNRVGDNQSIPNEELYLFLDK